LLESSVDQALNPELKSKNDKCIAIYGDEYTISGGGSGHVVPPYIITPYQGIKNAIDDYLTTHSLTSQTIPIFYDPGTNLTSALLLARRCQISIVVVAVTSSEGSDRTTLSLGDDQNDLVTTVADANPTKTIVCVRSPGAVLMPWSDQVCYFHEINFHFRTRGR
jgi:beta-glucosidase